MATIDRMKLDGSFDALSKREKLQINRQREKLEKNLGSISDMTRLPGALFVVDIKKEHIAVAEAQKLNIPIFAMVDTNSDPRLVDYVIPANDDASKSIERVLSHVTEAIAEGLSSRKADKDKTKEAPKAETASKEVETEEVKAEEVKADTKEAPKAAPVVKAVKAVKAATKEAPKAEAASKDVETEEVKAEEVKADTPTEEKK